MSITADDLDPDEIGARLGVAPTAAWKKGEVLLNRDGAVRRTRTSGRWSFSLQPAETDEWDADTALRLMMDRFRSDESVWNDIASRADVRVSLALLLETANQRVSLEPASLRWLADRNIWLDFELHVADDSEPELSALESVPGAGSTH
jgi:hypothetical protein